MEKFNVSVGKENSGKITGRMSNSLMIFIIMILLAGIMSTSKTVAVGKIQTKQNSKSHGTVAPLAKFKKNADNMFKMMGITKKQWLSRLPSKSELGVPVYPGVKLVVYQAGFKDPKNSKNNLLPEVILVSPDLINKIETWYAGKLKGWNHNKTYHAFLPPGKNVDVMSDKYRVTPHVELEQAVSKNQFDGMFLKQPANTRTGIIIRY